MVIKLNEDNIGEVYLELKNYELKESILYKTIIFKPIASNHSEVAGQD